MLRMTSAWHAESTTLDEIVEHSLAESQYTEGEEVKPRRTRTVLLGMRCTFTRPILTALTMAPDVHLAAVVLPANAISSPATASDPVLETIRAARTRLIEVPAVGHLATPAFRARLERIAPDLIVVACFPWRIPRWLLSLPSRGCLNVHPSLLPDGRGPDPVFWAFRWGLAETGVTLHLMDEDFDTGPVLSQRRLVIPGDATIPTLEWALGEMGAGMVLEHASTTSGQPAIASPQREREARYARIPRKDDLIVPTSWPVRDAARFIQAVVSTYGPIPVLVLLTGQRLAVDRVIQVDDRASIPEPVVVSGDTAHIQFAGGTLVCRVVRDRQPLQLRRPGA